MIETVTTSWTRTRRMLLAVRSDEGDVFQLADQLGWHLYETREEDPDEGQSYSAAWEAGSKVSLHYSEDLVSGAKYIFVVGENPEVVHEAAVAFEVQLDTVSLENLLDDVDYSADDPERLALAVLRAGLGAPHEPDERFFRRISGALTNSDSQVREGALWAISYSPWSQYCDDVRITSESDPDPHLRRTAGFLLEELTENSSEES